MLVGSTIHALTMDRVWVLLHARIASEKELSVLKQEIARLDLPAAMLQAMRGELAAAAQTLEALKSRPDLGSALFGEHSPTGETQPMASRLLNKLLPSGFIDHSEAVIIEHELAQIILPMKKGGYPQWKSGLKDFDQHFAEQNVLGRLHNIFARLIIPAYSGVVRNVTESETRRRQALAALAIESFRLSKDSPPSSLPDGIVDLIDEKPMRYRVEGKGYVMWSIAHDEEDDGGKVSGKDEKVRDAQFTGDWVWRMPARD
jgi:hypothetical protein